MKEYLTYGKAICYSGYREGQSPMGKAPSKEEIAEDIAILNKEGYKYIRMYDPNIHARYVLEVIKENGYDMQCMIGIDSQPEKNNPGCPFEEQNFTDEEIAAHIKRNDGEIDKLIALVKEFPEQVVAVSVGNENTPDWGAHFVSEDRLVEHALKLKANLDKPVTFNEGLKEWKRLKKLPEVMDFISVHNYPYHEAVEIENAVDCNKKALAEAKALFPDKQVMFTEVGWSTNSPSADYQVVDGTNVIKYKADDSKPRRQSIANQKRYTEELTEWLEQDQVIAFLFEAFDELWKGSTPDASECNFGLYYNDRTRKW